MKRILPLIAVAVLSAPAQASSWDIPRPQLEIPDQIAQASPARERPRRDAFDEAIEQRNHIRRTPQTSRQTGQVVQGRSVPAPVSAVAMRETDQLAGRIYIAGAATAAWIEDADLGSTNTAFNALLRAASSEATFDTGFGGLAAVGWRYLPVKDIGPRVEIELGYQQNDVENFKANNANVAGLSGDASILTLMANLMFDVYTDSEWLPYFGAGIGLASVDSEISAGGTTESSHDTVVAGQAVAGMAYALTDTTFLTLDYRYLIVDKLDLSGGTLEPRLHKASFGIRHQF